MAAVDLDDLVPSLLVEVNAPGVNQFPNATDDEWLQNLQNSFWEARLYGFFGAYTEADGLITPIKTTDPDFPRDQQQLIVLFSGLRVIRNELKNIQTVFRASAGSVEFEVQQAATLLIQVLAEIKDKINLIMVYLSDITSTQTTYIDSLVGREDSIWYGFSFWER